MDVTNQVLVLALLMAIGWVARAAKAIDDAAIDKFSGFVINVTLPALIVSSLQKPFTGELLRDSALVLGLSFAVYGLSFAFAAFLPELFGVEKRSRGVYRVAVVFSNVGFMGFPVVETIFGQDALFLLAVYNVPFNLLAFSVGAWLIARDGGSRVGLNWKMFVNVNVVATVVGFVLFLFSIKFPAALGKTLKLTGDVTTPLSMIAIGAILGRMKLHAVLGHWRVWIFSAVRLVALPAVIYAALYFAGVRGLLLALPPLVAAMPIAANASILATVYKGDLESASLLVFLSTLLSVVTIPAAAALLAG
jgi:predicted permease